MPEARRVDTGTINYGSIPDMDAWTVESGPEMQPPGSIRVEIPMKSGDPYRTFLSPEQSVCWHMNELLESPQGRANHDAGVVARLKAYIPVNGTYLPATSEVSTQSLQALMATAKIVKESKTTFIGHGRRNIAAATAGMKYNPKITENAGYSPSEILNFIMNERKRAVVAGGEAFFQEEPQGEGLSLLPPERDTGGDTTKITLAALVYSRAYESINPRVIDRNTIEAIAQGEEHILGWLGLDSDGWLTIAGKAILSEHDGNRLPCLTVDTFAQPRQNNEYALAAIRNNRFARFVLDIVSGSPSVLADHQKGMYCNYSPPDSIATPHMESGLRAHTGQSANLMGTFVVGHAGGPEAEEATAELDMTDLLNAGAAPEPGEWLIPESVHPEDSSPVKPPSRRRPVTIITTDPFKEK